MPAIVGSSVFLPLVLLDNLRMSNRIARSLSRFRNTLNQLCERQQDESGVSQATGKVDEIKDVSKSVVSQ